MQINISNAVLSGAAVGALTTVVAMIVVAIVFGLFNSIMSTFHFPDNFSKMLLVYTPIGAVVGGIIAALGTPLWAVVLVVAAVFVVAFIVS